MQPTARSFSKSCSRISFEKPCGISVRKGEVPFISVRYFPSAIFTHTAARVRGRSVRGDHTQRHFPLSVYSCSR